MCLWKRRIRSQDLAFPVNQFCCFDAVNGLPRRLQESGFSVAEIFASALGRFPNVSRDAIKAAVPLLKVENALAFVSR